MMSLRGCRHEAEQMGGKVRCVYVCARVVYAGYHSEANV